MSNEFVFTIHLSNTRSKCKKVVTDTNLFPFCGSWSLLHKARASCQVKQSLVATETSTISLLTTNYSLFRPITPVFIIYRNLFFTLSSHNNLQHVQKLKKKLIKYLKVVLKYFNQHSPLSLRSWNSVITLTGLWIAFYYCRFCNQQKVIIHQ